VIFLKVGMPRRVQKPIEKVTASVEYLESGHNGLIGWKRKKPLSSIH